MNKKLCKLLTDFRFEDPEHVIGLLGEDVVTAKLLEMLATIYRPDDVSTFIEYYNLNGHGEKTYLEIGKNLPRPVTAERVRQKVNKVARMLFNPSRFTMLLSVYEEACLKSNLPEVRVLRCKISRLIEKVADLEKICERLGKEAQNNPDILFMRRSIGTLDMSAQTTNLLKGEGVYLMSDLLSKTTRDLLVMPNLGRRAINEITESLACHGLVLLRDRGDR